MIRLEQLERLPKPPVMVGCVALIVLVGVIDYLAGRTVEMLPFYLVPVVGAAWSVGMKGGLGTAVAAAAAVLAAELLGGPAIDDPLLATWDLLLHFATFAIVAALTAGLRAQRSSRQQLMLNDPLTGLARSDSFYEQADHLVKTAVRYNRPVTLAYIGVHNFSALNTRFGHRTGDEVLVSIAQILRQQLRETDLVGRLGGDEFGILFPEANDEAGRTAVQKVRDNLVEATDGWPISFSIGAVTCDRTSCNLDELIQRSERLMRSLREIGANEVRVEKVDAPVTAAAVPASNPAFLTQRREEEQQGR